MATPNASVVCNHGVLELGATKVPLLSGAVHYFRMPKSAWRDALLGLRDLGLTLADVYVPWGVHEPEAGTYDFGQIHDRNDVASFVRLAQSLGLYVMLRPGPHINAELTRFGLPQHVLADEEQLARGPQGNPVPLPAPPISFPIPSHDSPRFRESVRAWYAALAAEVGPLVYPHGPIVLVQVDNESAFYFRDAVYDQDYQAASLARYGRFLKRRYRTLEAFSQTYDMVLSKWKDIEPPRHFSAQTTRELITHLDWAESQEAGLEDSLTFFASALLETKLSQGALLTHNTPMGDGLAPLGPATLQRLVALPGCDYYERSQGLTTVKHRTLRLVGNVALPYAAELGVGGPPWLAPRSDHDTLNVLLCGLAYGLRGFNLYMAVDRDRWYGAALQTHGHASPIATSLRRLIAALVELRFFGLRRYAAVAIVLPRLYRRLSRVTLATGPLSPILMDMAGIGSAACLQHTFGYSHPIQQHAWQWVKEAAQLLDSAQIPYVYVDSDVVPARLEGVQALLCPTYELCDQETCNLLHSFASSGRRVIFGPVEPSHNARMESITLGLPPTEAGALDLTSELDRKRALDALLLLLQRRHRFALSSNDIELSIHEDEQQSPRVVFAINFSETSVTAKIKLPAPMQLVDVLTGDVFSNATTIELDVAAQSCRALRVLSLEPAHAQ